MNQETYTFLKKDWIEPLDQLHSGGWDITIDMANYVDNWFNNSHITVLDLCCGEGASANYLSRTRNWNLTGIDINSLFINKARHNNNKVKFIECCVSEMTIYFTKNTFDCVYGQDPDALASPKRLLIFKQVYNVLKPGGMFIFHHHWIPGFNWKDLEIYWKQENINDLCAESYVRDLIEAKFDIKVQHDITSLASTHLRGCYNNNLNRIKIEGEHVRDLWLQRQIKELDNGKTFGIRIVAFKKL